MAELLSFAFATWLSGVGFFADAYDLFVINIVKNIMASLYPQTTAQTADLATAAIIGAVFGQLFFGGLADYIGRRTIFITTLTICIVAAIGSATCVDSPSFSIYTQLSLWRGLLGFGIGGEYPLSATVTAERSEESGASAAAHSLISRGRAVAVVFSMQGLGNLSACLVCVVLLAANAPLDVTWRASLAAGALPGLLTVYWRYKMEETAHFSKVAPKLGGGDKTALLVNDGAAMASVVELDADGGGAVATSRAVTHLATIGQHIYVNRWALAGTAGSWFIFDVVFYGNGLFTATILAAMGFNTGKAGAQTTADLLQLSLGSLCIAAIGVPGYFVAVALIDKMGRRPMQLMGFVMITVLFMVRGAGAGGGAATFARARARAVAMPDRTLFPLPSPSPDPCGRARAAQVDPRSLRPGLRPHLLLCQLRPQHDYLCYPSRGLPHRRAGNLPRNLRRERQDRRGARRRRHGAAADHLRLRHGEQGQGPRRRARHLLRARRARHAVDLVLHRRDARHCADERGAAAAAAALRPPTRGTRERPGYALVSGQATQYSVDLMGTGCFCCCCCCCCSSI